MQDKARNNWKQRLENADGFPDEILKDKNEAWEKLYARLHKKTGRKLLPWYWAAASLVAISFTTIIFFINKNGQSSPVITSSPATYKDPAATKKSLVTEQKTNSALLQSPTEKNIGISLSQKNSPVKKNEVISNYDLVTDSANGQAAVETVIEPVLDFDSSAKEITTVAPVKKKLRVIHINDIGQPLEKSTADNQFIERDRFQLKILNNETYNPIPTSAVKDGFIIFKSRNASN
jgi:hypothetical protein